MQNDRHLDAILVLETRICVEDSVLLINFGNTKCVETLLPFAQTKVLTFSR